MYRLSSTEVSVYGQAHPKRPNLKCSPQYVVEVRNRNSPNQHFYPQSPASPNYNTSRGSTPSTPSTPYSPLFESRRGSTPSTPCTPPSRRTSSTKTGSNDLIHSLHLTRAPDPLYGTPSRNGPGSILEDKTPPMLNYPRLAAERVASQGPLENPAANPRRHRRAGIYGEAIMVSSLQSDVQYQETDVHVLHARPHGPITVRHDPEAIPVQEPRSRFSDWSMNCSAETDQRSAPRIFKRLGKAIKKGVKSLMERR